MAKQPVRLDDLRLLCRLANQSAELMMSYINRGYSPEEIAETFSTIFFDQLTLRLDSDTAARFPRAQHGLPPLDQKAAAEQLIHIQKRSSQRPYRNYAIFTVLLYTGLRQFELRGLDREQFRDKHFFNIQRKGKKVTRKLLVPKPARDALRDYIKHERGEGSGPLIQFC